MEKNSKLAALSTEITVAAMTLAMLTTPIIFFAPLVSAIGGKCPSSPKIHLMEAEMDLKTGDTKGATTELNLANQDIIHNEQNMKSMMMEVKKLMDMTGNTTSMISTNSTIPLVSALGAECTSYPSVHLMKAEMDLKTGDTKGATTELNLANQGIMHHEQNMKSMMDNMMELKKMVNMKGNTTSIMSTNTSS